MVLGKNASYWNEFSIFCASLLSQCKTTNITSEQQYDLSIKWVIVVIFVSFGRIKSVNFCEFFFWKICCSLNSLYKTLVILFYTHILLDTLMTTPMGESLCHLVRLDVNLMLRAFFHGFYFIGSQVLSFFCWVFCMFKRTLVRGLLARVS